MSICIVFYTLLWSFAKRTHLGSVLKRRPCLYLNTGAVIVSSDFNSGTWLYCKLKVHCTFVFYLTIPLRYVTSATTFSTCSYMACCYCLNLCVASHPSFYLRFLPCSLFSEFSFCALDLHWITSLHFILSLSKYPYLWCYCFLNIPMVLN